MSEMMSQAEIDALLTGGSAEEPVAKSGAVDVDAYLSKEEQDTLGEIGNICMGTSATTMYTLLGRRVEITTPTVQIYPNKETMFREFDTPFIVVEVEYIEGVEGNNLLLLSQKDAALITDVLLGGEGQVDENVELSELHISAINEVMNQMVGSSATALANILKSPVNISTPNATVVHFGDQEITERQLQEDNPIIRISFDIDIENLLNSKLMQVMPLSFGTQLVSKLNDQFEAAAAAPSQPPPAPSAPAPAPAPAPAKPAASAYTVPPPPAHAAPAPSHAPAHSEPRKVDVQPVSYRSFDSDLSGAKDVGGDIGLLNDVPLHVTVELGKTKKPIREVLEFGVGSIIILDRLAGEPVDILVNGKLIARGEVVVIDDNYGVRITDIITPSRRI